MAMLWNAMLITNKTTKQREADVPTPLPRFRKRVLTIPVPEIKSKWLPRTQNLQATKEQRRCPLFKLPYEIRNIIWKYTVAGEWLHITRVPNQVKRGPPRFLAVKCPVECDGRLQTVLPHRSTHLFGEMIETLVKKTRGFQGWPGRFPQSSPTGFLAILLSCRAIYSETVVVLHLYNTFDFHELDTLIGLSTIILPQRLNTISSLQFQWVKMYQTYPSNNTARAPFDMKTWQTFWRVIAGMAGLRKLQAVILDTTAHRSWATSTLDYHEQLVQFLNPLCAVKQTVGFNVDYFWYGPMLDLHMVEAPFRFSNYPATELASRMLPCR